MHFRCVFTLLLCCMLVGLDWAEPMMYLNLHVTYSCIFMHRYLQVSIFYIVYCWCFFYCLSLSLSLVTCPSMIIQEFYSNMHGFDYSIPQFVTRFRGIRMVVTLGIVSEVLHIPRVTYLDYPSCERLWTVSKDELSSLFCETTSSWGDR